MARVRADGVSAARAHALRRGDRVRGRRHARPRHRRPADRRRRPLDPQLPVPQPLRARRLRCRAPSSTGGFSPTSCSADTGCRSRSRTTCSTGSAPTRSGSASCTATCCRTRASATAGFGARIEPYRCVGRRRRSSRCTCATRSSASETAMSSRFRGREREQRCELEPRGEASVCRSTVTADRPRARARRRPDGGWTRFGQQAEAIVRMKLRAPHAGRARPERLSAVAAVGARHDGRRRRDARALGTGGARRRRSSSSAARRCGSAPGSSCASIGDALEVHTVRRGPGRADGRPPARRTLGAAGRRAARAHAHAARAAKTSFSPNPEDGARAVPAGRRGRRHRRRRRGRAGPRTLALHTGAALLVASTDARSRRRRADRGAALRRRGDRVVAQGFCVRLDYDGQTQVDGEFRAPVAPADPKRPGCVDGLRRHRETSQRARRPRRAQAARVVERADLLRLGRAVPPRERIGAARPRLRDAGELRRISRAARGARRRPRHRRPRRQVAGDLRAQRARHREVARPEGLDRASKHARGQHVLLWWKAWDPEGLPPELCIRNADGKPVALDPNNAAARERAAQRRCRRCSSTSTPTASRSTSRRARRAAAILTHEPGPWGIALLHELLRTFYDAAKAAKPEALVITHTPHPAFVDVTDMIRLNDVLGGVDLVEQMEFRAEVVRARMPRAADRHRRLARPGQALVARLPRGQALDRRPVALLRVAHRRDRRGARRRRLRRHRARSSRT